MRSELISKRSHMNRTFIDWSGCRLGTREMHRPNAASGRYKPAAGTIPWFECKSVVLRPEPEQMEPVLEWRRFYQRFTICDLDL